MVYIKYLGALKVTIHFYHVYWDISPIMPIGHVWRSFIRTFIRSLQHFVSQQNACKTFRKHSHVSVYIPTKTTKRAVLMAAMLAHIKTILVHRLVFAIYHGLLAVVFLCEKIMSIPSIDHVYTRERQSLNWWTVQCSASCFPMFGFRFFPSFDPYMLKYICIKHGAVFFNLKSS